MVVRYTVYACIFNVARYEQESKRQARVQAQERRASAMSKDAPVPNAKPDTEPNAKPMPDGKVYSTVLQLAVLHYNSVL